jgi:hypothetical protein
MGRKAKKKQILEFFEEFKRIIRREYQWLGMKVFSAGLGGGGYSHF